MRICKIEGCEGKHEAKGYCQGHYKRYKRNADISVALVKRNTRAKMCSIAGCKDQHKAKGLCLFHYGRKRQGTRINQEYQNKDGKQGCSIVGCEAKHRCHGYCDVHWQRTKRTLLKKRIVQQCGGKCLDCKSVFPFYVFDFDNIVEEPGHTAIGKLLAVGSEEAIQEELKRCELVCANCHRIRTFARYPALVEEARRA